MHVLYVLTKLELGGAQKVCLTLLEQLKRHNIHTTLLSGTQGPLLAQAKQHQSVFLLDSFKREVSFGAIFLEIKTFFRMIHVMRQLKKTHSRIIVHTHSTKAGILGRWAALFAGIRIRVHTVHGYGFHDYQPKLIWWVIWLAEYITSVITTHFVCVSQKDRETGITYFPRFAKKSSIIRAAVDYETFFIPAKKSSPNTFTFGTISCLKPQKNLLDLLQAFAHVHSKLPLEKKQTTFLQIIGDGIQRAILESWIKKHRLEQQIKLLGWQTNVVQWMHQWQAFCMSSLWEGLPCAVIEARLSKLPVISYDIAGIPEIIKHHKNGFLAKPGNYKALAQYMFLVATDPRLRSQLSSHKENLSQFTNEAMVRHHAALYQQLFQEL